MKQTLQILILVAFGFNLSAQNVIVDPKIKVDSTKVRIKKPDYEYNAYSTYDNKKIDSLTVTIGTVGTSVIALKINLTEKPSAYITLWSDYPEYDGDNTLDVEFEYYDLILNDTKFDKGEVIMGKIKGKSIPVINHLGEYQLEFDGEFNHIIGKLMIKRKASQKYRIIDNQ